MQWLAPRLANSLRDPFDVDQAYLRRNLLLRNLASARPRLTETMGFAIRFLCCSILGIRRVLDDDSCERNDRFPTHDLMFLFLALLGS